VSVGNACSAGFGRQSEVQTLAKRLNAAAGSGLALEQENVMTLLHEFVSRAQTGKASADNQHSLCCAPAFWCRYLRSGGNCRARTQGQKASPIRP
jgi:hypothetical protein